MAKSKEAASSANSHEHPAEEPAHDQATTVQQDDLVAKATTVGVIGVGVALLDMALIPGMILGVGAMLVPKLLPRLEPAFRWTVRGAYQLGQKTRHAFAEAHEQVQDIVAETKATAAPSVASPQ